MNNSNTTSILISVTFLNLIVDVVDWEVMVDLQLKDCQWIPCFTIFVQVVIVIALEHMTAQSPLFLASDAIARSTTAPRL